MAGELLLDADFRQHLVVVSLGCGVLWVEPLNQVRLGGFKLGFWFAQQGAIYAFIILTFIYARVMARLEKRLGLEEPEA